MRCPQLEVLTALVICAVLSGCAPHAPDDEAWTDEALQSIDDVSSDVATMRLVLELERKDRVTVAHAKVAALDSEEAAGMTTDSFASLQPPTSDDGDYRTATGAMSDAADLLAEVRIAVVRENTAALPGLIEDLAGAEKDLSKARDKVLAP